MNLRSIFFNPVGRLRSGWRFLSFILAALVVFYVIGAVLWVGYVAVRTLVAPSPRDWFFADLLYRLLILCTALGAGYLCARFLEGLPWRSLGLTLHRGWLRDFLVGSAVGLVSLALAVGIAAAAGGLRFSITGTNQLVGVGKSLFISVVLLLPAALAEEAMFRGYPLQTLMRARLAWLGLLITAFFFGQAHLDNPNVIPGVTLANTALAGIWLAVAYLKTRSLWLPLGVHWAWNWALGFLFGLPISGANLISHPLLKGHDLGPAWITGGSYGIEGGVAGTIALAVSTVFLWFTPWPTATPELKKLTSEENPAQMSNKVQ